MSTALRAQGAGGFWISTSNRRRISCLWMGLAGWSRAGWAGGGRAGTWRSGRFLLAYISETPTSWFVSGSVWIPPLICPLSAPGVDSASAVDTRRTEGRGRGVGLYFQLDRARRGLGKVPFDTRFCYFTHSSKVSWMRGKDGKGGIGMGWANRVDVWLVRQHVGAHHGVGMERLVVLRWSGFILRIDCVSVSNGGIFFAGCG